MKVKTMGWSVILSKCVLCKRCKVTNAGKDVGKWQVLHTAGGNTN